MLLRGAPGCRGKDLLPGGKAENSPPGPLNKGIPGGEVLPVLDLTHRLEA